MNNLQNLKSLVTNTIKDYPQLKDEVTELYYLAVSEIEEGGSESHECDLAERDILELIEGATGS
jgi:hypothetical protein